MVFWRNHKKRGKRRGGEIAPEDILADTGLHEDLQDPRFEGKVHVRIGHRSVVILMLLFITVSLVFVGRMWNLQITQGEVFAKQSENNHLDHEIIFPNRGMIFDRNEEKLAWNDTEPKENLEILKRLYFDKPGLSHILGYVSYPKRDSSGVFYDNEYGGEIGAEHLFDDRVGGEDGVRIIEINALGEIASQNTITPPQVGENIHLSIDAGVQSALFNEIKRLAEDVNFEGGAGVIIDIHTGEILALTSYPEFSSQVMADGEDEERITTYLQSETTPFLNRATQGLYTPGSIVKPFMALAALNEGIVTPQETILSTGEIRIENPYVPGTYSVFRDWKAHGRVDVVDALAVSSNVYFYVVSGGYKDKEGFGIDGIYRYAKAFKLGEPVGTRLFEEEEGVIPHPAWKEEVFNEEWRLGDTYHTAIGQYGFQVTPLQMVRAVGALARKGILIEPTLIKGEVGESEEVDIAIDEETYEWVQRGMREAVLSGTAGGLNTQHVAVAGKTGTAEVGTEKKLVNSWVVGYFPYEQPRYAFVVVMEKGPSSNLVGGTAVMRRVLDWMGQNTPEYFEVNQ